MQSSRALKALPVALALAAPLCAQSRYQVNTAGAWIRDSAGGKRLAQLAKGTLVDAGAAKGTWLPVTIEGWIWGKSVGPGSQGENNLVVTAPLGENLRERAKGQVVAQLPHGFALQRIDSGRAWIHVRRTGWVSTALMTSVGQVTSTVSAAATAGSDSGSKPLPPTPPPAPLDTSASSTAVPLQRADLYGAPGGAVTGTIGAPTPLKVLAHSGEWTRVQLDAWVKTNELASAPTGVLEGVSAAELRADPARYLGQVVRWRLQFVASETADDLRPDIPDGATYLLTRGPAPERGFVYVIVPESKKASVAALTPLTDLEITATVRVGKSHFIGNPIVDLVSFEAVR
ncbi:MAG TPA: hypothetical protein VEV39_11975 [Gemmatimonadales bacterium]|nr:hypothetical protein [Gemmatimonadales bacterium]